MSNLIPLIITILTISDIDHGQAQNSLHSVPTIQYSNSYKSYSDESQYVDAGFKNTALSHLLPDTNECKVTVKKRSEYIFHQTLKKHNPNFVQFHITMQNKTHRFNLNKTSDVFQPGRWYWTLGYKSKPYPFLTWDLRYGIFTFGLLDFKTALVQQVFMMVEGKCNLTLGTEDTTQKITQALIPLVNAGKPLKYTKNYFCYLSVDDSVRDEIVYLASVYFLYPIVYINYKCCFLQYNYTNELFDNNCSIDIAKNLTTNVITYNIILGILIIAYCPIPLFKLFAWLGESDDTKDLPISHDIADDEEWIYANGQHPLTFFDVMSFQGLGIDKKWPILISRLRRFICLIMAPLVIYVEIYMNSNGFGVWKEGDKITLKDLVDVGAPVGFMALLGNASNRHKVFAPTFGGPLGIVALYFGLGFIYVVLPKCLKNVVDKGLPDSDIICENLIVNDNGDAPYRRCRFIKSPLFFGSKDIIKLSQIKVDSFDLSPGYTKGGTLMRCNFYMLFNTQFWSFVLHIQLCRACSIAAKIPMSLCFLNYISIPLYISICFLEVVLCILYFGVPFFFFLVIMIRAAMKMIPDLRRNDTIFTCLSRLSITIWFCKLAIFISILLFAYCIYLLIVASLTYVTQIITYCFVAVTTYPSVAFGNLFLLVVVVYYLIRQLKLFSYNNTKILFSAVAISKRINETPNHVACYNGHLIISSVNSEEFNEIEINGRLLDCCQNDLMTRNACGLIEMKMDGHSYGVPKDLFLLLIRKYRPKHKNVLSLLLRIFILIFWVYLFRTITYSYGLVADDQIAEVLHVIFIIAVGALPKLIESDLVSHANAPKHKIETKLIEQTIIEYWTKRKTNDNGLNMN